MVLVRCTIHTASPALSVHFGDLHVGGEQRLQIAHIPRILPRRQTVQCSTITQLYSLTAATHAMLVWLVHPGHTNVANIHHARDTA